MIKEKQYGDAEGAEATRALLTTWVQMSYYVAKH